MKSGIFKNSALYLLTLRYSYRTQGVYMDALPSIFVAGALLSGMLLVILLVTGDSIRRDGTLEAASR
jgi:hypothetical protein